VPTTITAETARLAAGSIQAYPVCQTATPATTTPRETVDVALATTRKHHCTDPVQHDADRGDDRDEAAIHGWCRANSLDRLPHDPADREQHQAAVRQGGKDRRAPETVGSTRGSRSTCQDGRAPGHPEAEDITEVVGSIGEQRGRVRGDARDDAEHDERDIEQDPHRECTRHPVGRRMMVPSSPVRVMVVPVFGRFVVMVVVAHDATPRWVRQRTPRL
jgi:hypothetical protein